MKRNLLYLSLVFITLFTGCYEGIDPITLVDPGPDQTAPVVSIKFPVEGTKLQVLEVVTSIDIKFEVTDDIEIGEVKVLMDGAEIAAFNTFKDYRRFLGEMTYDNVTNGPHTLTVTATDLEGKTTSASVNFEKEKPYEPKYAGEILYMPFDGDFIDLVSITRPTVVGNPGFAGESVVGLDAYAGATDSYLRFPTEGLLGPEFSAVFWMKVNGTPDRAGILVIGPEDAANPTAQNNRKNGFRFFRENAGGKQRFKLNVGNGVADTWFDGGAAADVDPASGDWVHFAFTISGMEAVVYIDGQVVKQGAFTGVDWTGCDILSIMSGEPRFTGWSHKSDLSYMDELRMFDRALSQTEIQDIIFDESGQSGYQPKYDGEIFYLPFDGDYTEMVGRTSATVVGTPGFDNKGIVGDAYAGAAGSYLTFPTDGLLGNEFSAAFWLNINAAPDRAGILVIGPPDPDNPDAMNKRTSGFRFFREGGATNQIFKLNVGTGDGESWFDGGATATVDPTAVDWVHLAFTISGTECVVYIDGEVVKQGDFTGVDWADCNLLSIMSGAPRFTGWGHQSDLSLMDELRLFNKALSQDEIKAIIEDEN